MTLVASKSGRVTGAIFLSDGSVAFPEPGWNDFVATVLSWWLAAMCGPGDAELMFMDGPYLLRLKGAGGDMAEVQAIDRHGPAQVRTRWIIERGAFRESVVRAAEQVLGAMDLRDARDIAELRDAVRKYGSTTARSQRRRL